MYNYTHTSMHWKHHTCLARSSCVGSCQHVLASCNTLHFTPHLQLYGARGQHRGVVLHLGWGAYREAAMILWSTAVALHESNLLLGYLPEMRMLGEMVGIWQGQA
jgi:hypothetical protein